MDQSKGVEDEVKDGESEGVDGKADSDVDIPIGNEPAVNDAELAARVRSVITSSLKRKENPNVFSVVAKSSDDLSAHRVGTKFVILLP